MQPERGEECEPRFNDTNDRFSCSPSCKYRLSGSSASSQSSKVIVTGMCAGNECAMGGNDFCGAKNAVCVTDNVMPCLRCIVQSSSTPFGAGSSNAFSRGTADSSAGTGDSTTSAQTSSATIVVFNACGNGRIDAGEECDNAAKNLWQPNAECRPDCSLGRCGDGVVDTPLELCDEGSQNGNVGSSCTTLCRYTNPAANVLPGTVIELPFTPGQTTTDPTGVTSGTGYLIDPATGLPPENTASGPATVAVMAAGAAAGYAWMRRRKLVR